jgi:hypothetical protein
LPPVGKSSTRGHRFRTWLRPALAPSHRTFFSYRLDFDLVKRSSGGCASENNDHACRPPENRGLWFGLDERLLPRNARSFRFISTNRFWKVVNR